MSEATQLLPSLSSAPAHLVENGAPLAGLYAGSIVDARFDGLAPPFARGPLERRLVEKKWQYVFAASDEVMLALAIVDCGYLSSGFCAVFDRGSRRLLADESPVLPPLFASVGDGPGEARLRGPRIDASIARNGDRVAVRAQWAHVAVDLQLSLGAPALTAVASVGEGRFDYTQKNALLQATGEVRSGNARFVLDGAPAGLDYTHGYLARETSWRWAFAAGPRVAFNFSEGFLQGAGENAVWLDGALRPAGPVRIAFDDPMQPWRIEGEGVDLRFVPEGLRRQTVDLKLISSRYAQPFGRFEGTIFGQRVESLAGVTEDHTARW